VEHAVARFERDPPISLNFGGSASNLDRCHQFDWIEPNQMAKSRESRAVRQVAPGIDIANTDGFSVFFCLLFIELTAAKARKLRAI